MVLVRLIALLSLMLCAVHGAERFRVDDVRAFGGVVAQDLTTRSTTNGVDSHIDSDALNARVGLEYMRGKLGRHGGFLYGAAFSANRFSYDEAGVRTTLNEPTIEALAGYGIAPGRTVHFELTAIGGIGYSFLGRQPAGGPQLEIRSRRYEYGAMAAVFWTIDDCWQLGIAVPYLRGHSHPIYSYILNSGGAVRVDERRDSDGIGAMLTIGVHY